MSRVGKLPIAIPSDVKVDLGGNTIKISGKQGDLEAHFTDAVNVSIEDNNLWVKPANDSTESRALWGTYRSNFNNMVQGVSEGFTIELEVNGVGYRAMVEGRTLKLFLGFSHEIHYAIPEGVNIQCPKPTEIIITGSDKQLLGQVAAEIRSFRPPEPYKGKGVKYKGEWIRRKEGKKK